MSHEIRTPLNGIIGITDLLLGTGLNPEQARYCQVLQDSGSVLLALIHDILDFSKIEAGKLTIESLPFDVHHTLDAQIGLLMGKARAKDLRVEVLKDQRVPAMLRGDSARIGQIVLNLLGNAIKFTDNGGKITLRTTLLKKSREGILVEYRVEDSGIGISSDQQKHLFNPFTQADGSTARKYGGTGLGLSISKRLAEMMNGTVGMTSRPGVGSHFWFTILFKDVDQSELDIGPSQNVQVAEVVDWVPSKYILVAEDSSVNQMVIKAMLKNLGHMCRVVSNGAEAVTAYKEDKFDLILVDCQMPEMDGYEATIRIRELEKTTDYRTPIYAFTANVLKEDQTRCYESGMDNVISKPLKIQALTRALADCFANEHSKAS